MAQRPGINEVIRQFTDNLAPEFRGIRDDLRRFMRANLESMLQRMDLVSREEYDIQVQLLNRLRARVDKLEQQLHDHDN